MSAEHAKAKEPLPTRPPRPHPQGFVLCLDDEGHKELSRKLAETNKRSEDRPR
ncbi:hypothetical protein ACJ6WF_17095 [Streptomyces sp. MMS24-I2-30]|uniref:hypothetical protein n=1 Tax=Streptomyces sp. MMS24-I2-30 TaxID=3351564 RepID=UPI003896DFEE